MSENLHEAREIPLSELIPFHLHPAQTYQDDHPEQLVNGVEGEDLSNPIVVRPAEDGKYEIICGHNRIRFMREFGHDAVPVDVRSDLTDEEAEDLYYDDSLSPQTFSGWSYSQRLRAMHSIERLIKANSRQGQRSDLKETQVATSEDDLPLHSGHKLNGRTRRITSRDQMADRLGIATATLSKYRSIVKLPDDLIELLARMLDEKKITFEAAYIMSGLKSCEVKMLVNYIEKFPDRKIDLDRLKALVSKSKGKGKILTPVLPRAVLREVLIPNRH